MLDDVHHFTPVSPTFLSQDLPPYSGGMEILLISFTNSNNIYIYTEQGLVLRRFFLRRFTFTTLAETDRALPTCGASLSQLKRPFCTQCTCRSFPVCMCFFFFIFQCSSFKLMVIFAPMTSIKKADCPLLQKGTKRTRKTNFRD